MHVGNSLSISWTRQPDPQPGPVAQLGRPAIALLDSTRLRKRRNEAQQRRRTVVLGASERRMGAAQHHVLVKGPLHPKDLRGCVFSLYRRCHLP